MLIPCCIATPQFHGSADNFHMHKQSGHIDTDNWEFYSDMKKKGDHNVSFHTEEQFKKSKVKC